jgi:Bacterial archaeo-eukaryotic release factor family 11
VTSLHTDIPTRSQVTRLLTARSSVAVSLYLPTEPQSSGEAERIELKNLTTTAIDQLRAAGTDRDVIASVEEQLADLIEDDEFWRFQARTLAVFVTPDTLTTFRLPNQLTMSVEVSDRFHVKPLMRTLTFTQAAFVLELAKGSVRLLEIVPELRPAEVRVPDMPTDAASAVGKASITERSPIRRLQGSEGQKVRMRQYARQVDQAMRPILTGQDVPLILAAVEPLDGIFRSLCSYPNLAPTTISPGAGGQDNAAADTEMIAAAREVLDDLHASQLDDARGRFDQRVSQGRTATDIADVARFATQGAVDTLFVDIDSTVPGLVDERTGAVEFRETPDATDYGVLDEISRRVWLTDGRIFAVRREDVPGGGETAAILRFAPGG